MFFKIVLVLVYLNCVFGVSFGVSSEPVVKTSSGSVKGLNLKVLNHSIEQFLGIPYAEPPLGSLRFAKPKPISKPIEGVIDGTVAKHSCIQGFSLISGGASSEDCLVLNVWAPKRENNSTKLKPVMFWIYGGALSMGSIFTSVYNGSVLATHDIVFVSVNYRLGHFGFLYGGDESAPGNMGFYDQLQGLKWVRENIHLFGGDKNQITIFGESAGSWSVSTQIISPLSKGLFQRAIMESGAHMYQRNRPVLTKEEALIKAKQLAKRVNCTDDKQWLECLRKVDAKQILSKSDQLFFPTDGTEFLPNTAQKAFQEQKFNKDIDLIAGVVRNEGPTLANMILNIRGNFTEKKMEEYFDFANTIYHNINKDDVIKYYLDKVDVKNSTALKTAFYDAFGDIVIKCPTYHFAKQFAKSAPNKKTYFYELTYEGTLALLLGCDEKTMGICHGADVEFVFGVPLFGRYEYYSSPELSVEFSREVMKMWTNFAKTGNPGENWPQMLQNGKSMVKDLDPRNKTGVFVDPFLKSCDQFWKNYFQ